MTDNTGKKAAAHAAVDAQLAEQVALNAPQVRTPADIARQQAETRDTRRSHAAAQLDAVRGRILDELARMAAANTARPGDGEGIRRSKAATAALIELLTHAADQGIVGVRYQLDAAHELGAIFGAVLRARSLSRASTLASVEDLAAAVGQGAARAALGRR